MSPHSKLNRIIEFPMCSVTEAASLRQQLLLSETMSNCGYLFEGKREEIISEVRCWKRLAAEKLRGSSNAEAAARVSIRAPSPKSYHTAHSPQPREHNTT